MQVTSKTTSGTIPSMKQGIKGKTLAYIADNLMMGMSAGDLTDDSSFLERGIIDSTGVIELIAFIEETFGIEVDDDEIVPENLDSLRNVERFVLAKLAMRGGNTMTA